MSVYHRITSWIGSRSHTTAITALVLWLSVGTVAVVAAQTTDLETPSPAQGRVQVISQGMTNRPALRTAWRVVKREIPIRAEARPSDRLEGSAGFLLAQDGPVFVIDQDTKLRYRLAPGEAQFVPIGANQTWASTGQDPTTAYTLELALRDTVDEAGNGEVVYNSGVFGMLEGDYDVDLLRGVQPNDERTTIEDRDFPILVFVTQGQVDVQSDDGTERLHSGQAGAFDGEVQIRTASNNDAVFLAAVIGASVGGGRTSSRPTATPTATVEPTAAPTEEPTEAPTEEPAQESDETPTAEVTDESIAEATEESSDEPTAEATEPPADGTGGSTDGTNVSAAIDELGSTEPEPTAAPTEVATEEPAEAETAEPTPRPTFESRTGTAVVRIEIRLCPAGMNPESFDPDECRRAVGGFSLALVTPFGEELRQRHADRANGHYVRWGSLKSGIYVLEVRELPEGYASYSLDGFTCCTQDDGFRLGIGRGQLVIGTLYFFLPE